MSSLTTAPPPTVEPRADALSRIGAAADARTDELDAGRRLPDDLHLEAARAGLYRQLVPRSMGGPGLAPLEWFRNGVALAHHDASLAWVVTQGAAELAWIAVGGDDEWARDLLSDPLATSASSSAGLGTLTVDGASSRIAGRWAFNTGSPAAAWIGGMALVDGAADAAGRPVIRWAWVPADRAEVLDDWDPTGLRGTGSHSTVIPTQEIPTAWTFSPHDPTGNDRGPHRVLVGNGNWPIAASVAAVQLGNARRALDEAAALVLDTSPPPAFVPLARNAAVQRMLSEAEGLWAAALAGVERELEALWAEARRDGELRTERRVRTHRAALTANALSVRVVDLVAEATGTRSMQRRHVLGRCRRDAHALEAHISVNGASAELNAAMSLGLVEPHLLV